MTPFRQLSLRSKLNTVILGITVTSLGGAFGFAVWTQIGTFKREMVANTVVIARVVADYSVSDLAFGDRGESRKTLERLKSLPNIRYAYLFDARGELFATYGDPKDQDPRTVSSAYVSEFRDGALHVTQPISHHNEKYGTIHLCASTRELDRKVLTYLLTMLGGLTLLMALAYVLAVRLQSVISGPILSLAAAARRISKAHDYSIRVSKAGEDEIGALCDGFNEMLSEIQARELERDKADRRTREKSQFLANMSHELRTPMNSIIGFSEVLLARLGDRLSPKELKFLQNINTSGHHLLRIINDILDLSKVEAGRMDLHPETFSVRAMIEGVCHVMKGVSSKRNVTLTLDAPDELPPLEADPLKFKQILYNLLSNAVKFSPHDAAVAVRVRRREAAWSMLDEDSIEVAVSDQGPGIDPKDHERIFQEFRQTEAASAAQAEGTGLGLALVKRLAELHRGRVLVRSTPGEGTTLTVILPRFFRPSAAAEAPDSDGASGPRILVVGDDPAAYEAIRRQLEGAGYVPLRAHDRDQALKLAREARPAAITLDPVVPNPDGWEILKALKADPITRLIPVIVVPVMDNRELGPALGAADYFLKHLDQERIVSRVRSLAPASAERPRLLVVDDESEVHELLEAWLTPLGYDLDHARSGLEGLDRATARPPDLIVLDLLMKEMDGFEAAVRLKADARTAWIPILVLTAKDLTERDRGRLRGRITTFVQKGPATEARLVSAIEGLLHPRARGAASGV